MLTLNDVKKRIIGMTCHKPYVYTHGGVFHTDDVMCAGLLLWAGFKGEFVRVNKLPVGIDDTNHLVFDIGNGHFDHHQNDVEIRPNGIKYASFGLLIRASGLLDVEGFENFDRNFAEFVDKTDNGQLEKGERNTLRNFVFSMNPQWDEDVTSDEQYLKTAEIMRLVLEREFQLVTSRIASERTVRELVSAKKYIDLPKFMIWEPHINKLGKIGAHVLAAIYPSRGAWAIKLCPAFDPEDRYKTRGKFDFTNNNKPDGCSFVHAAGFIATADTHEAAIEIAEKHIKRRDDV